MAIPPTFVAEYGDVWNSASTPQTASVTVDVDDMLVVIAGTEDAAAATVTTPTGGGLTYTLANKVEIATYAAANIWTAPSSTSQTYTIQMTSGGGLWGFNVLRFSGCTGAGASTKTNVSSGAPSLALTTTDDGSVIVVVVGDWNAVDGTSRTWRTVNGVTPAAGSGEVTYFRDSLHYVMYGGYYSDAGVAGAQTVGLSAPGSQKYSIVAVEILGRPAEDSPRRHTMWR